MTGNIVLLALRVRVYLRCPWHVQSLLSWGFLQAPRLAVSLTECRTLELVDRLNTTIGELTAAAEQEARKRPEVLRLMTHPGVGPITALVFVLVLGSPDRTARGGHTTWVIQEFLEDVAY
jgi:transposase